MVYHKPVFFSKQTYTEEYISHSVWFLLVQISNKILILCILHTDSEIKSDNKGSKVLLLEMHASTKLRLVRMNNFDRSRLNTL